MTRIWGGTDKEATVEKLLNLPVQHFFVLLGVVSWSDRMTGEIVQPVTADEVRESYCRHVGADSRISERVLRDVITDLETMGLVETWIKSMGREGRVKQIETTFDPAWVKEAQEDYIEQSTNMTQSDNGSGSPSL